MDQPATDHAAIMATPAYREMLRRRRRLVLSLSTILFALLMALTALAVFTDVLDGQVVPGVNGLIIGAYVVFLVPVAFAHLYVSRVRALDVLAERAVEEARGAGRGGAA